MARSGYVKLRRGILDHVQDGRITLNEAMAYILIIMEASPENGLWLGSAKALSAKYGLNERNARHWLKRLHAKGYIKRFAFSSAHGNYPILVNKYIATIGANDGCRVNAEKTSNYRDIAFDGKQADCRETPDEIDCQPIAASFAASDQGLTGAGTIESEHVHDDHCRNHCQLIATIEEERIENSNSGESRESLRGGKKRRPSLSDPPDRFEITEAMRLWGSEKAPGVDLDGETEAFLDHHRAKGSRFIDWNAAWKNWIRRARQWGSAALKPQRGGHSSQRETADEHNKRVAEKLREEERKRGLLPMAE